MNPLQQMELARLQHQELLRQMHEQRWAHMSQRLSWWQRLQQSFQRRPQVAPQAGLKLAESK